MITVLEPTYTLVMKVVFQGIQPFLMTRELPLSSHPDYNHRTKSSCGISHKTERRPFIIYPQFKHGILLYG